MLKMVVFDMAGTTVNEDNVVYKTLHRTIVQTGLDISLGEVLRLGAGKEKKQAIMDILREYGADFEDVEDMYHYFINHLDRAYQELQPSAMPGAEAIFALLRSKEIKVVLNTGYDRKTALLLLQKLNWTEGRDYDLLVTADQVRQSRPYPDMILKAMAHFDLENGAEVAKIGDSTVDIEEGIRAGCGLVIGVTTGAHTRTQLEEAQPTHIMDSLSELEGLV